MDSVNTTFPSNKEYLMGFNRKSAQLRIPLSGSLDLTHRCNLRCIHCYLGDNNNSSLSKEMNTKQIMSVIDQVTEAGCLYFLLSGGEPFLRKDFPEIYTHAKKNGLLVTIFTNGTMVTDEILELFSDLPPRIVEISLYGATASTYEKITRVPGSFEKCLKGIRQLLDKNINVRLKTILMTLNSQEFFNIEHIAKDLGTKFRFDAGIFPCLNGDRSPIKLRVPPEDFIKKEFSDEDRVLSWKLFLEKTRGYVLSDRLYNCAAGITFFHIDPYGNLQPCIMVSHIKYNLLNGSFLTGWRSTISTMKNKKAGESFLCNNCKKKFLCNFCPAFFKLENGSEDIRSEYLCTIGNHRYNLLRNYV
jgi:radical SAM protein with 4Fe4S-binding SPASM domain